MSEHSAEALRHCDETGHQIQFTEGIWACFDCPWTDSSFAVTPVAVTYESAAALWREVKSATQSAMDAAYGTDPRHGLLARAVAYQVAFGRPLPWGLSSHFGRTPPAETGDPS